MLCNKFSLGTEKGSTDIILSNITAILEKINFILWKVLHLFCQHISSMTYTLVEEIIDFL